jgi:hypothetical protein
LLVPALGEKKRNPVNNGISESDIPAIGAAIARKFIVRPDVLAEQCIKDGDVLWVPRKVPWTRSLMASHLRGEKVLGHCPVSLEYTCRVLTFDIQYMNFGLLPSLPMDDERSLDFSTWKESNPQEEWKNHKSPIAPWMTYNFRACASYLYNILKSEFNLESTVAYNGKGLEVYGFFPKLTSTQTARQIGLTTLEASGGLWEEKDALYISKLQHPLKGTMDLTISILPEGANDIIRVPLGKNLESPDPCFFVDMTAPLARLVPLDAKKALAL